MSGFIFRYEYVNDNGQTVKDVVVRVNQDAELAAVLEEFGCFLEAAGFKIDGSIDVVEDDGGRAA